MKKRTIACIFICILVLVLSACRTDDAGDGMEEAFLPIYTEAEMGDSAYPAGDAAYPVGEVFIPIEESAYPITEADLVWLLRAWRLESYAENEIESKPPLKVLTLNANGSYTIATDTELEKGTWSTILLAVESTLILTPESGNVRYYQIIDLSEDVLNLRTIQGTDQIDEEYLPDDSTCECD